MTKGEISFEKYCNNNSLNFERNPETNEKEPDYFLNLPNGRHIIIEIKDLEDNREDIAALDEFEKEGTAVWGSFRPGNRIQNKINSAKNQLKKHSTSNCPLILLICDNRNYITIDVSDYEIAVGMYGVESIGTKSFSKSHGKWKKMTSKEKTYISYIGVINDVELILYENFFAKNKLTSDEIKSMNISTLYIYETDPEKSFGWIKSK